MYRDAIAEWARTASKTDGHQVVVSIFNPPWEARATPDHDSDGYETCEEFTEDEGDNFFG